MDRFELRLKLFEPCGKLARILLALHKVGVAQLNRRFQLGHLGGELLSFRLDFGDFRNQVFVLLFDFGKPPAFGEGFRLLFLEKILLARNLAPENGKRLLSSFNLSKDLCLT